jgi:hypothetical protein
VPDNLTIKEKEILGSWNERGLTQYGDINAYLCSTCDNIFGVTCPKCGVAVAYGHGVETLRKAVFTVERPIIPEWNRGYLWVKVVCGKCDYRFKVIYKS